MAGPKKIRGNKKLSKANKVFSGASFCQPDCPGARPAALGGGARCGRGWSV